MSAKAELAEFVMDHLSRSGSMANIALASVVSGLASILAAYNDAQERRGNWGIMLANLKNGRANIDAGLPMLRTLAGVGAVIEMADRELYFAQLLEDEIVRITAGESTNL